MTAFYRIFVFFMIISLLPCGFHPALASKQQYMISGKTMGTFYTVKFISSKKQSEDFWKKQVATRLKDINHRMSMYDPQSELSDFNRSPAQKAIRVSHDFYLLLKACSRLHTITRGAWDGTVKPLVDLWGFGTRPVPDTIPPDNLIRNALEQTGFRHILIQGQQTVIKEKPVMLDLGSIAKGYGVDSLAKFFAASGIKDVLVEIGGELSASGGNMKNSPWVVGINRPDIHPARQGLYRIVSLDNMSIATSGNYRNFHEMDKKLYSHIINPATGYPVANQVVSASVISKTCAFADGLATALMVMDIPKGIDLVNSLDNTECLIIQKKDGRLIDHMSGGFDKFFRVP